MKMKIKINHACSEGMGQCHVAGEYKLMKNQRAQMKRASPT